MSHSKRLKRGRSLYLQSWNRKAQKYLVSCVVCGVRGFRATVLEDGFDQARERMVIQGQLKRVTQAIHLDEHGRCLDCAQRLQQ